MSRRFDEALRPAEVRDVRSMIQHLEAEGALQGLEATREDVASDLGWSVTRLAWAIQNLKERSGEFSYGISLRRGSKNNLITLSRKASLRQRSTDEVLAVDQKARHEHIRREARNANRHFMHYRNIRDTDTAYARATLRECQQMRMMLSSLQALLDLTNPVEIDISADIDLVLTSYPT